MDTRTLKNLLKDQLEIEKELHEFCIECLKRIYGEHSGLAISHFNDGYNYFEENGCIQSLEYIDSQLKLAEERRLEREANKKNI